MQAIILAAGMGKRLKELTSNATKCMVEVNGQTMIERVLKQLDALSLSKVILVVGYEADKLIEYIKSIPLHTQVEFIRNDIYDKTNNIYSLYLAKEELIKEDTLLLESDIICEDRVLTRLVENPYPSLALVAKYENWMDGTVVTLDDENNILRFISKKEFQFEEKDMYYKTVNIYKFSKEFSRSHYVPFLEAYCKALGYNEYYEQVLKVITLLDHVEIKAEPLEDELWYEIDDVQDLNIAESIFSQGEERLKKLQNRYGGYWRYENMLDFCYLVNPYYPNAKLKSELKSNFDTLLTQYPSGMAVNSLIAAKYWGLRKEQVCVGNGAAELIKSLMNFLEGKIGVIYPTFEEYPHRKDEEDIVKFSPSNDDYRYQADEIMDYFATKEIRTLLLINPDNPSGNYIPKKDVLRLLTFARERGITFVLDESFVDFAEEENNSFLELDTLLAYENLVVVKSISKSFGVPGLRLGVVASSNEELIAKMKKDVAIWNINSFGEYYLQICEKYTKEYQASLVKIKNSRKQLFDALEQISYLRPIPSQANYIMCEVSGKIGSKELTETLLNKYQILIKDCATKNGFEGRQFVRIAVRDERENACLLNALHEMEK